MKGFEIKRENEKPIYLFNRFDVVSAIAHALYYTANPQSEMCIPNCAYERAEKEFDDWFNDTRAKKVIETFNEVKRANDDARRKHFESVEG
jgi:hypothetical protein